MRLTGSRAYTRPTPAPKMPAGLVELMEGLTKDVLKNNPDNLYEFCAGHMQKLIDIRDGNLPKKHMSVEEKIKRAQEKVRQRIQDRLLQRDGVSRPSNDKAKEVNSSYKTQEQSVIVSSATDPKAAIPIEDMDKSKQLVNHQEEVLKDLEVEKFHEPNVTVTTADIYQEPHKESHESLQTSTENDSANTKNEEAKKDSPLKSDTLRIEKLTKEIETDVNNGNIVPKDVSITSENFSPEDLIQVSESEKVSEIDVEPISSETYPIENSANKTKETTTVQPKPFPKIEHVGSESLNDDKLNQNTDNISLEKSIQRVASNLKDSMEKLNEPEVATAMESQVTEKTLSIEAQSVEVIKKPTKENDGIVRAVHESLDSESVTSPKPTENVDDVNKKNHDTEKDKIMNVNQLEEQSTANLEPVTSNYNKEDSNDKKGHEEKYSGEKQDLRLESKSVDSTSIIEHSESYDASVQDVKENEDMNSKKVENPTVSETFENLEHLKSSVDFENTVYRNELPVVKSDELKKVDNPTVAEAIENAEHLKNAAISKNAQNKDELPVVEGNTMQKVKSTTVAIGNSENLKGTTSFGNGQNNNVLHVLEGNVMKKVDNTTVASGSLRNLKSAASIENGQNINEFSVVDGTVMKKVEDTTVAIGNSENLKSSASIENGQNNNELSVVEGKVMKKVEDATVAKGYLENLKSAASFEIGQKNNGLSAVEGNVLKKGEDITVAIGNLENLNSAASSKNGQNNNELSVVEENVMKKVEDTTVAIGNLEDLKSAGSSENGQNNNELSVVEENVMKKVEDTTVGIGSWCWNLKSAASSENVQNNNELPVVEENVMKKVEDTAVAIGNLENLKCAASSENGQNNNELPLLEENVMKKVEDRTVAIGNLENLKRAASFENGQNNDELPIVEGNIMKKIENDETIEKLEHLKSSSSFENGKTMNELPVVDGNVIYAAREFLEHERQFSSKLATEVSHVVSEKQNLENNTIGESDATMEPNSAGTGMDLETAAVTIQKVFRTFLFSKSRTSTLDDGVNENSLDEDIDKKGETEFISNANLNKERRALGISRMDTVLQTVNEEKSLSLSTDDSSLSSAATIIQAHVRGFLVRNRLASNKNTSSSSLVNSEGPSTVSVSLDGERNEPKKTILNIHIVPERGQFMSRDESMLTSIDLPLDNSPPSSVNLHPLGYDKSEPRKQLKREDAIQSVTPPSNNSGKLSEEVDSVKENVNNIDSKLESENAEILSNATDQHQEDAESCDTTLTISSTAETVVDAEIYNPKGILSSPEHTSEVVLKNKEPANLSSDEMDVVTPFPSTEKITSSPDTERTERPKLIHTGEFHDMVVQTQVKRCESSVVREFKNVLVYFLLWDKT